jgi:tetratricopeptide (TPR) repeat protein
MPFHPYSYAHAMWGYSIGVCGEFREAEKLFERALSLALETDHTATIGTVQYFYGLTLGLKGDGQGSREHLENAIKDMEASHTSLLLGPAWACLGYAHCLLGQPKIAVDLTEKGLKMHTELGMVFLRSYCHWACSYAHFEASNMAQARAHADFALKFALENNEKLFQSTSRMLLGYVLSKAEPGKFEEAEREILEGINMGDKLGLPGLSVWGYSFLGEAYAGSGRRHKALETMKKAEALTREMGMDYWLNKAQEALTRLGG